MNPKNSKAYSCKFYRNVICQLYNKCKQVQLTIYMENQMKWDWNSTWSTILCLRMVLLAKTFMATLSPVSLFCANLTLAKVPSPIVRPTSYFATLLVCFFMIPQFNTRISPSKRLRFSSKALPKKKKEKQDKNRRYKNIMN